MLKKFLIAFILQEIVEMEVVLEVAKRHPQLQAISLVQREVSIIK